MISLADTFFGYFFLFLISIMSSWTLGFAFLKLLKLDKRYEDIVVYGGALMGFVLTELLYKIFL